jgi:hypothetical protein
MFLIFYAMLFEQAVLPCTLKDSSMHCYHQVSWPSAELLGVSHDEMEAHRLIELIEQNPVFNRRLNQQWADTIHVLDQKVSTRKEAVTHKNVLFNDTKGMPAHNPSDQIIGAQSAKRGHRDAQCRGSGDPYLRFIDLISMVSNLLFRNTRYPVFLTYLDLSEEFHA